MESESELFEGWVPPEYFFSFEAKCYKHSQKEKFSSRYLLPSFGKLLWNEEPFADVFVAWEEEGLHFQCDVQSPLSSVVYPEYEKGDAVELFIDTKNLKNVRVPHRFCHHFYFLPETIEGSEQAQEITRFRAEDARPLCSPENIQMKVQKKPHGYVMDIFLLKEALTGFEPLETRGCGFAYRILRTGKSPQHFTLSSCHCKIERHPYLWATLAFEN